MEKPLVYVYGGKVDSLEVFSFSIKLTYYHYYERGIQRPHISIPKLNVMYNVVYYIPICFFESP